MQSSTQLIGVQKPSRSKRRKPSGSLLTSEPQPSAALSVTGTAARTLSTMMIKSALSVLTTLRSPPLVSATTSAMLIMSETVRPMPERTCSTVHETVNCTASAATLAQTCMTQVTYLTAGEYRLPRYSGSVAEPMVLSLRARKRPTSRKAGAAARFHQAPLMP